MQRIRNTQISVFQNAELLYLVQLIITKITNKIIFCNAIKNLNMCVSQTLKFDINAFS